MHLPTIERLAKNGLTYTNFHTAPICSASRVALLTGRNPHSANMGTISEMATGFPGQTSILPNSVAPLAKILRFNGYSTAMFGKSHEYVPWESGLTGPFDQWPTGLGFEKFYGNVIGESDQFSPVAHDNTTLAPPLEGPELLLSDRSRRSCDPVDQGAEVAESRQAVLHLLPGPGHARSGSAPHGVAGQVQGQVRHGMGQVPRGDSGPPEEARHRPREHQAHGQGRYRAGLGHADRRRKEGRDPLSGTLCGVCRADRLRDRPRRAGDRRRGRLG